MIPNVKQCEFVPHRCTLYDRQCVCVLRVQYIVLYSKVDIVRVLHGCTQYTVGNVCVLALCWMYAVQ